jgi:hypothetical protein
MYLKDNSATTFNIWQDDHTKFKVPGPPVYEGSDSQVTPSPLTNDLIDCLCGGGTPTGPKASVTAENSAPSVTSSPGSTGASNAPPQTPPTGGSGDDCGAAFVSRFPYDRVKDMLTDSFAQKKCQEATKDPVEQQACGDAVRLSASFGKPFRLPDVLTSLAVPFRLGYLSFPV